MSSNTYQLGLRNTFLQEDILESSHELEEEDSSWLVSSRG